MNLESRSHPPDTKIVEPLAGTDAARSSTYHDDVEVLGTRHLPGGPQASEEVEAGGEEEAGGQGPAMVHLGVAGGRLEIARRLTGYYKVGYQFTTMRLQEQYQETTT